MRSKLHGALTLSGWGLRHLLHEELRVSVNAFAREHKLSRLLVQRAINGRASKFTVDFATDIARATNGRIGVDGWRSDTATRKPPDHLRPRSSVSTGRRAKTLSGRAGGAVHA